MTAEQISLKNLTGKFAAQKGAGNALASQKTSDFFSDHLSAKLANIGADKRESDIDRARSRGADQGDNVRNDDQTGRRERADNQTNADQRTESARSDENDNVYEQDETAQRNDGETGSDNQSADEQNAANNDDTNDNAETTHETDEQTQVSSTDDKTFDAENALTELALAADQTLVNADAQSQATDAKATTLTPGQTELLNQATGNNKQQLSLDNAAQNLPGSLAKENAAKGLAGEFGSALDAELGASGEESDGAEILATKLDKQAAQLANRAKEGAAQLQTKTPDQTATQLVNQLAAPLNTVAADTANRPLLSATNTAETPELTGGVQNSLDAKNSAQLNQVQSNRPANPVQSIAIHIAQKAQNGIKQFEIRLNPPELGRVDVRLEFGRDGQVTTHLIVEKPETLDMLNKDARQLERALADAGMDTGDDGLSFSLKDQQENEADNKNKNDGLAGAADDQQNDDEPTQTNHRIKLSTGLDISV